MRVASQKPAQPAQKMSVRKASSQPKQSKTSSNSSVAKPHSANSSENKNSAMKLVSQKTSSQPKHSKTSNSSVAKTPNANLSGKQQPAMKVVSQKPWATPNKQPPRPKEIDSNLTEPDKIIRDLKSFCNQAQQSIRDEDVEAATTYIARANNAICCAEVAVKPSVNTETITPVESVSSHTPVLKVVPYKYSKWEYVEFDLAMAHELTAKNYGKTFMHVTVLFKYSFVGEDNFARLVDRAPGN